MVKLMLSHGADPNLPELDAAYGTALFEACRRWDVECVTLLLEAGANANAEVDSSGCCLSQIVDYEKWGNHPARECTMLLREHGAVDPPWSHSVQQRKEILKCEANDPFEKRWESGYSDFHNFLSDTEDLDAYVARCGNERIASRAYENAYSDDPQFARRLLFHGVDPNRRDWLGRTVMHHCAEEGNTDMAKFYLEQGGKLDVVDVHDSTTPLGYAARNGHLAMTKMLLENGADPTLPLDREWGRPIEYAQVGGHSEIVELLRS